MLGEELKSSDAWDPPTLTCVSEKVPLGFSGNQLLVLPKSFSLTKCAASQHVCKAACSSTLSLLQYYGSFAVFTHVHTHTLALAPQHAQSKWHLQATRGLMWTCHRRSSWKVDSPHWRSPNNTIYDKRLIYTPTFLYIEITRYKFDKSLHVLAVHLGNI